MKMKMLKLIKLVKLKVEQFHQAQPRLPGGQGFINFTRRSDSSLGGFTLLETLITLAVLALLATVIASGVSSFRESAALDQAADEALEIIREARAKALGSEGASSYGVYFASSSATLFKGGVYGSGDPANIVIPMPSGVSITSINLSTTTASVVFERLSSASYATGTVIFTGARSGRTKQIQILESGAAVRR